MVKQTTVRLLLSPTITNNWSIRQSDVNNAFLNEELQEDIYMTQPPDFEDLNYPTHVCHLHRAIYSLK
jgi:Reverse transcriptase (RNA-dependent DNA polymerase)